MIAFLSILAVGFFLGMRHATDPDHVIAVTTIVSNQSTRARAALIGAFWGVGHTLTILIVGAAIILFNLVIPVRLGLSMELSVAVMLIILGVVNVASFLRSVPTVSTAQAEQEAPVHTHAHQHGTFIHTHPHSHESDGVSPSPHLPSQLAWLDHALGKIGVYQYLRPLLVGIVHGLAGSAAVALLVLTTIRDSRWAVAYLLLFGIGTIAGMMLITLGIASTFRWVAGSRQSVSRNLAMASGLLSVTFGLIVAYQICIVSGLFTTHATWTPH